MKWWLADDDEWSFEKIIKYLKNYDTVHVGSDSKYYSQGTKFATAIAVQVTGDGATPQKIGLGEGEMITSVIAGIFNTTIALS